MSKTQQLNYLRLSEPVPVVVVVVEAAVVVKPVLMLGITAAESFSLSALSSDQYLLRQYISQSRRDAGSGGGGERGRTCW